MNYIASIRLTDLKIDDKIAIQLESLFKNDKNNIKTGYCGSKIQSYDTHSIMCNKTQLEILRDFCNQVLDKIQHE